MSLELGDITIENFGTIEHIKLKLNTPGLILVTGRNKDSPMTDSNGAGKSLILDAIFWCIWGKTVRGLKSDSVIRRQVGKDCCVSLSFKEGKTSYVIVRHRNDTRVDKPNDLRLFINGVEKGKKMKNLQEVIDRIFGFDFDTCRAMMPGAGVSPATLTDTKIKELLEKLLQTEQLSDAYVATRERLKILDRELVISSGTQAGLLRQLGVLEQEVAQLRALEESFDTTKAETVANHKAQIAEYDKRIAECDAELVKGPALQASLATWKQELQTLRQQLNQPYPLLSFQQAIRKQEDVVRGLEHDRAARARKIESFHRLGSTCPTCESPITAEHVAACEAALKITAEEEKQYQSALAALRVAREEEAAEARTYARQKKELGELFETKEFVINTTQSSLSMLEIHRQNKGQATADRTREVGRLQRAEAEQHNFTEIFATKSAKVAETVQALCQCLTTVRELKKEHALCSFWVDGFSPTGLRSYMLDYVTPILNDRAEYYCNILTGGEMKITFTTKTALKSGEERDQFQIVVEQKHGGDAYEATSKGEKARADLVIALALGDLATFRTSKQLPWRFLDEPFENIDDAGTDAVMQLLNDQKSRYKTVFVVTHKPAFKKLFNQRITIVKENSVSRLEQG